MSTHLLTAQMAGVLDRIARARRPPVHTLTPVQARAACEAGAEVLDLPRAPLGRVENLSLPGGDDHPRPARLHATDRLRAAGVVVRLDLVRGVAHDFIKTGRAIPEAGRALDFIDPALRELETT